MPVLPPNLEISAAKAPKVAAPGATISVRDTTRNSGSGLASPTTTRIWLSTDKTLDGSDIALGARDVPALAAGAQHVANTSVTLPSVAPGSYYLLVQADADGESGESNEADNVRAAAIRIGPDLTITTIQFSPATPTSTSPTTITLTIKNLGGQARA